MVARTISAFCVIALATLAGIGSGQADEPKELSSDIRIESATATPGPVGGTSEVRFRIVNESPARLILLGVATPVAERANLVAGLGSRQTTVLESIGIPAEDTLDLTTSHLRYEIFPLKRPLVSGEEFPVTLHFVGFSVGISVHVH